MKVSVFICFLLFVSSAKAQMSMPGMTAMENSVGFLSSGTSVEPRVTSESTPMIHKSLGNWTLMFHANGFLVDTQQSGPRGKDKLFATNWLMPNENRWNIDKGKPDSFSSRVTLGMGARLSGQFSIGRINHRAALEPDLNTVRTTASIHHSFRFSAGRVSSSLIWGRNKDLHKGDTRVFNAYTAESTMNFLTQNWVWTRIENVDRDRTVLAGEKRAALETEEDPIGRILAFTFGYERALPLRLSFLTVGLGFQATMYGLMPQLKSVYGNRPTGFSIFLHLRPASSFGAHMQMMHQH